MHSIRPCLQLTAKTCKLGEVYVSKEFSHPFPVRKDFHSPSWVGGWVTFFGLNSTFLAKSTKLWNWNLKFLSEAAICYHGSANQRSDNSKTSTGKESVKACKVWVTGQGRQVNMERWQPSHVKCCSSLSSLKREFSCDITKKILFSPELSGCGVCLPLLSTFYAHHISVDFPS